MRKALLASLCLLLSAQDNTIRTRVNLVVAPATVTDAQGRFVDGLTTTDFVVLDNGEPRSIHLDTSDIALTPISLVLCVQANHEATSALAKFRKVGSLIDTLITGDRGEAALLRMTDELQVVQDFTSDGTRIRDAFRSLKTRGTEVHALDGVARALDMLRERPAGSRKIIILIAESRDRGSSAKLPEVLQTAQRDNVTIYPLTFSVHLTPWTAKPEDVPPPGGFDILRIITELGRAGKANTADELARFTGGRKLSFLTLRGLESDLSRLGEELHSQYLLSFAPPARESDESFHVLQVTIRNRPELHIVTRPGYWPM